VSKKKHAVRKIRGVYNQCGHIVLKPETEARLLVFPKKPVVDYNLLGECPEFEHEIDDSGCLEDIGPRGPARLLFDATYCSPSMEELLIAKENGNDSFAEDGSDISFPYDEDARDPLMTPCSHSKACNCRAGTCMLAGAIKALNGKSSSERPKIPRGNIPIACGQCLNSFG
jgi:hypothetical protein